MPRGRLKIEEGKLTAKHPAIPPQTMLYFSDNLFLLQPENAPLKFTVDDNDKPVEFEVQLGIGVTVIGKKGTPE